MPTPADAPYKRAQRDAEQALRASRRVLVVDRSKLCRSAFLAAGKVKRTRGTPAWPAAVARLRSLWSRLTRAERRELTHEQEG